MEWRGVWRVHVTCGVCRVACGVACGVGRDNVMHQALGSYSVSNIKCIETTKQWKYAANTMMIRSRCARIRFMHALPRVTIYIVRMPKVFPLGSIH